MKATAVHFTLWPFQNPRYHTMSNSQTGQCILTFAVTRAIRKPCTRTYQTYTTDFLSSYTFALWGALPGGFSALASGRVLSRLSWSWWWWWWWWFGGGTVGWRDLFRYSMYSLRSFHHSKNGLTMQHENSPQTTTITQTAPTQKKNLYREDAAWYTETRACSSMKITSNRVPRFRSMMLDYTLTCHIPRSRRHQERKPAEKKRKQQIWASSFFVLLCLDDDAP